MNLVKMDWSIGEDGRESETVHFGSIEVQKDESPEDTIARAIRAAGENRESFGPAIRSTTGAVWADSIENPNRFIIATPQ